MSTWHALNIESDSESDIDIDDTKELRIEDALKLYQTALKFHAQGPASFDQAAEAYRELFESEIFRYPESQTELQRIELYGPTALDDDDAFFDAEYATGGAVANGAVSLATAGGSLETGPSTLPQILHLSHKNYAQFRLEYLTARLDNFNVTLQHILNDASDALEHFVQALDKDDSDLDLWRKSAKVGGLLGSKRVARFCLEAVLEGDEEGLNGVLALPGLEEGLAGEQLLNLLGELHDRISMLLGSWPTGKRRTLSKVLKRRLEVFRTVEEHEHELLRHQVMPGNVARQPERVVLKPPATWAEMGELLLNQLLSEEYGTNTTAPASAISFGEASAAIPQYDIPLGERMQIESVPALSTNRFIPPTTIATQYPGLDNGKPTTQPAIASADPSMTLSTATPPIILPTRKRSGDAAGLQDGIEEGRPGGRSKRTRLRESGVNTDSRDSLAGDGGKQALLDANARWEHEQQLNEIQAADDWVFETVGALFERIGVVRFDAARRFRHEIESGEESVAKTDAMWQTKADLRAFLEGYSDVVAQALLQKGDEEMIDLGSAGTSGSKGYSSVPIAGAGNSGTITKQLTSVPEDSLGSLIESVNNDWWTLQETAWQWLLHLLMPGPPRDDSRENTYTAFLWPELLKTMVVRVLVNLDRSLFERAQEEVASAVPRDPNRTPKVMVECVSQMVLAIYELHLDIYTLIKQPNSGVEADVIIAQSDRLQRWAALTRECLRFREPTEEEYDSRILEADLRFLWATTFQLAATSVSRSNDTHMDDQTSGEVSEEHVLECMEDLRRVFLRARGEDGEERVIHLVNNAVMSELSIFVLDKEIARLTTRGFMRGLTEVQGSDAVSTIEKLEPLLRCLDAEPHNGEDDAMGEYRDSNMPQELVHFLQGTELSVRLLLWQRLRDAYAAIDYQPMVVSSCFTMMRILMDELKKVSATQLPQRDRILWTLKTIRVLKDLVGKVLQIVQTADNALECIDDPMLKADIAILGELLQLVQVFNIREDSIRVGESQAPTLATGGPMPSYKKMTEMVHDLQLSMWMILYALLKETIYQNTDLFPTPTEDKFDFLRSVHRNLGLRRLCSTSNRVFLKLLKDEFVHMTHVEGYESEQAQVLYDLYGLNCFLNPSYELIEHHCTHDAFLERGVAMLAIDLLLVQARKLPVKELVKHSSLRDTIEKVHTAVPRKKPSEAIMRNREVYRAFLRSPINPLDMFNALKGNGNDLPISVIPKEDALLASKGWYFLMGHLSLGKFKYQKRTTMTATEDVDTAIAFFHQDLEVCMDNWETWFRLAQAYDTKVEESVVWSAEKLNSSMPEIVVLQRHAIHCFTMALALVHRSGGLRFETSDLMTELYTDFAARIYASSREPFGMLAFALDDEKWLSRQTGMGRGKAFTALRSYTAWKFSKVLIERALEGRDGHWSEWFALGKCVWKMFDATAGEGGTARRPQTQEVLDVFFRAIDLIPHRRDSREKKEPVLEPHYKLVSIVHKMMRKGEITLDAARAALDHTSYARAVTLPQDPNGWTGHVLAILKNLRTADKSNWHHRMIARAARVVYGDPPDGGEPSGHQGALAAKHELTQQMFTKTMVLNVWRPECERAGRHFVYTARYTRFFTRILEQLADRPALEALARRVRRRPHEIFDHGSVWQDICNAYLRLLRKYGELSEGLETSTFSSIVHEDFLARKEPLEKWMQGQDGGVSKALDVLREVQELKRINQGLMKPGGIDDLIGDAYAFLFCSEGKRLWEDDRRVKMEDEVAKAQISLASPVVARNPMMSLNALMNLDGVTDSNPTPSPASAALAPLVVQATTAVDASTIAPRKKIGVGRREIRTCAEACVQKAAAARTTALATTTRVEVVIKPNRSGFDSSANMGTGGERSVATSVAGSVHDDADDESELSELEEVGELEEGEEGEEGGTPRPMFPGLRTVVIEVEERSTGESGGDHDGADVLEGANGVGDESGVLELPETPSPDRKAETRV
ncbi:hypothetical protein LTR62_004130 [Meristemomyces frigidus]|uniref:Histone transcription regulator 3 homolog n=1 Tax=Meristemomyces frigidus TaxID=1508187 RepID=A0AAN7TI20_9PEZI|nr:hypothetical protein LTR62_004130 [Meristemomyces frigidus]